MKDVTLPRGYFQSKAWENHEAIQQLLMRGPKTFKEICKALEQERDLKNAKSSVLNALRVMVGSGEVVGEVNAETLEKTGGKLAPLYRHTGNTPVYHGGAHRDAPSDGSDWSILRLYKDDKGNIIAQQYFKKIKRKYTDEYTYRAISPILALDAAGNVSGSFDSWKSFWTAHPRSTRTNREVGERKQVPEHNRG